MDEKPVKELRGWWISPSGDYITVQDHFRCLLQNPEQFGYMRDELAGIQWEPKGETREKYLKMVFQRDWIRVREHKGHTTYEFWQMSKSIRERIKVHLKAFNFFPEDQLNLSEVSTEKNDVLTVEKFLQK